MTLEEWLHNGETRLRAGPHPERARRDADLLLRHLLKLERAALLVRWREILDAREAAHYQELLQRRLAGEPVQYITGEAEFYGLPLQVSRDVLIPRPETEHVVEKAVALAGGFSRPRIVDVGTGSGAIALALARELPQASVTAVDVSKPALEIAKENARRNGVSNRIRFTHGDLLAPVAGEQFDLVVSNPPYVATSDRDTLDVEVREYEPPIALFAGQDGLSIHRRLIWQAHDVLISGGFIVLEIGYNQAEAVSALLLAEGFDGVELTPDLQGIARVASARRAPVS